jgi:hypothetical protein
MSVEQMQAQHMQQMQQMQAQAMANAQQNPAMGFMNQMGMGNAPGVGNAGGVPGGGYAAGATAEAKKGLLASFGIGTKQIVMGIGAGIAAIAVGAFLYWGYTHPSVHIVNASSSPTVSIFVDDKPVATDVKAAPLEHAAKAFSTSRSIATGKHTIVTKDASGKVLDTQTVEIEAGGAYLYAPAHLATVCWTLQTDGYGTTRVANPLQPLDRSKSFWRLDANPNYWFSDTPDSVKVDKKKSSSSSKIKTAIRQHACNNPNFEP